MRNRRLDILRGIAVLLVVFYHGRVQNRLIGAGWAGVDLFFVLSGFLISGLLFAEYKRTGSINLKRFFIRRGLKLYPAFYFLLFVTFVLEHATQHVRPLGAYLGEMFYVQNYGSSVWTHTWSLAVEEQFYILLPLFLLALMRWSAHRENPFRAIPAAFLIVAIACAAFRFETAMRIPISQLNYWENVKPVFEPTHERMDSLFFGVLLGYLCHFKPQFLEKALRPLGMRVALALAAAMFLSTAFLFHSASRLTLTFGYTWMYLGFGILLLLFLRATYVFPKAMERVASTVGGWIAWLGMYSYSVYLWHLAVLHWQPILMTKVLHVREGFALEYFVYLIGSIALGVGMSRLIEYPILRLRDMMFPAGEGTRSAVYIPAQTGDIALSSSAALLRQQSDAT